MNFEEQLIERTEIVNDVIKGFLPKEEGMQKKVIEAMNYSISAGGKRIRPLILMETYKMCGGDNMPVIEPFMAAIEYIHTYSLVHDDLPAMDNDEYRRGKLTTHKKFGEDFGILAGDGLQNYAYETMLKAFDRMGGESINNILNACITLTKKAGIYGMVGGQSLDVELTDKLMNTKQLDFIFNLKTGALIEAAFIIGGSLAGADRPILHVLEQIGNKVGVAFQIQDDILDITGSQDVIGKPVLSDQKNNKITYVTLYGMEKAQSDVQKLSKEAMDLMNGLGDNVFLKCLVDRLINREK